jgi:hypothetical protein
MQLPILWHTALKIFKGYCAEFCKNLTLVPKKRHTTLNFIKDLKVPNGLLVYYGSLCGGFRGDEANTEALAVAKAFRAADGEFSRKFPFSVKVCD